ncbi:hypothetical protein diail_659 [Diaporthe ilicicola]|nr:hypothetical protein diail_659 [Diaporthe ilicicola]
MKFIWFAALTLASSVLGSPLVGPELHHDFDKRQGERHSAILTTLLKSIDTGRESRHRSVGSFHAYSTLDKYNMYPGPITGDQEKAVALVVGAHFENITANLWVAHSVLSSPGKPAVLLDESGEPCDAKCITNKTIGIVKETGKTAAKSVLKPGLNLLGKSISPAFLALSGIVVTLNAIVSGALAAVAALVNGTFLAIAAGDCLPGPPCLRQRQGEGQGPRWRRHETRRRSGWQGCGATARYLSDQTDIVTPSQGRLSEASPTCRSALTHEAPNTCLPLALTTLFAGQAGSTKHSPAMN